MNELTVWLSIAGFVSLIILNHLQKRRIAKLEDELLDKRIAFREMSSFVFCEAKFADSKGIADKGYDSSEVLAKWNRFHELHDEYYGERTR